MTEARFLSASDWDGIRLVVFDVDGTLYRQRPLRLRMAAALLSHLVRTGDIKTPRVLRHYRSLREKLAAAEMADFTQSLLDETAAATGVSRDAVRTIVTEWIDRRPLDHLARYRYPGLVELFDGLRRHGKSIGVLSDYSATAKLAALGLKADHIVSAEDDDVALLKPHPKGLETLMRKAGATPDTTVMIGDRAERDGLAARRAAARALIRSSRPMDGWQTFAGYEDALFGPLRD